MTTVIVDCGSGNLRSAEKAFQRMAAETEAGEVFVTDDPGRARRAERIVLPGVGAFADCIAGLAAIPGMRAAIEERVLQGGAPFLGICVGMQMLATTGREFGSTPGLGWIAGEVVRLAPSDRALKIPHMGWNELEPAKPHPLLEGLGAGAHAYFVHSYYFAAEDPSDVVARVDYGGPVTAAVARGNVAGVQFHPEKSQAAGLRLIGNFLRWRP